MRTLILLIAALILPAGMAAQTAPAACDGRMATIRVSEIKPGGTVDGFLAAVAAHQAWLTAHGVKDENFAVRIVTRDETTHDRAVSGRMLMTFHIHGKDQPNPKRDESYDAFVKLYRDNSDIKSEYDVCLPDSSLK